VYKVHNIKLPRDTSQQVDVGESLTFVEESQPGDLAFFENPEGKIIHVGIMLDNQKIIHASGKVRIDTLDSTGIFNKEMNKHTHKLRVIKSIL
jgi:cell wall-associated NlpC family hydrolase